MIEAFQDAMPEEPGGSPTPNSVISGAPPVVVASEDMDVVSLSCWAFWRRRSLPYRFRK